MGNSVGCAGTLCSALAAISAVCSAGVFAAGGFKMQCPASATRVICQAYSLRPTDHSSGRLKAALFGALACGSAPLNSTLGVMKLAADQVNYESLTLLGHEVCDSLLKKDFAYLADKFGYAVSFGRQPAHAIAEDLEKCFAEATHSFYPPELCVRIKTLDKNISALCATIECLLPIGQNSAALVELVVSEKNNEMYITLEQISAT